jgi:Mg2+ and Co2+ transporter CorA
MSLSWYVVKNHEKNGKMRSASEIGAELDQRLGEIERITGIQVDDLLREEIGAGQWLAAGEAPANYSHPVIRLEAHGDLTLVVLAVPSSLHNGIADFTNVLMLAHPKALLTVIRDPGHTYSAEFGGRLLADFNAYKDEERSFTAGEILYRATRSCALSVEASLATLRASVSNCFKLLRAIELREQRARNDLDSLEAEFGKTLAELRAMVRTPNQLINVCNRMDELTSSGGQGNLFDTKVARQVTYLKSKIAQVEAILGSFIADIERAIKRCDDVSKRELLDAQRRNTYWTSALLLPNLIYAFFGQSFLGDAREGTQFWWISGVFLLIYGIASSVFLFRLSYRGK